MYKVEFIAPDVHTIVIQFTQCTTIHNITILHKIAISMIQNEINKVTILHNNNNNNNNNNNSEIVFCSGGGFLSVNKCFQ